MTQCQQEDNTREIYTILQIILLIFVNVVVENKCVYYKSKEVFVKVLSQCLKEVILLTKNLMNILQLQHFNVVWLFFLSVSLRIKGGFPFTYESGLTLHPLSAH